MGQNGCQTAGAGMLGFPLANDETKYAWPLRSQRNILGWPGVSQGEVAVSNSHQARGILPPVPVGH
jgi:hypothetical protein